MKSYLLFGALLLSALPALADDLNAQRSVSLTESADTVRLSSQQIGLVFEKRGGKLKSFTCDGKELLASGGAYVQLSLTGKKGHAPPVRWEYRLCRNEPSLIEISFVNVEAECPFDLESHYVLRAGERGFYNYLMWGHDAKRSPGVHEMAQFNFCLRADPHLFTTAAVDDERIKPFPAPEVLKNAPTVMDSTFHLPDGSYYSKYFYSAVMDERHIVHGMMGSDLGLWLIMPSHEHLNDGPQHAELTVHQTTTSPVLLGTATAAHYGAGVISSDSREGSWSKASAPWFFYVNQGASQAELWRDAKRLAAERAAAWPYDWLDNARFQRSRGQVAGTLVFDDGQPAGGARIILAAHEEHPLSLNWQQQWRGYRFYGWCDADGRFSISRVRPGNYDLYAWKAGTIGAFAHRLVKIEAGQTADLGKLVWSLPRNRQLLWQIGTPDRSAGEFGFADHFRQWGLWDQIAEKYPNGVDFIVGKSRDRDLPFILAVTQNQDLSWHKGAWRIAFDSGAPQTGRAILTVAVTAAESIRTPSLRLALNQKEVGSIDDLHNSGAIHRSGLWGLCEHREIAFDAGFLKPQENVLEITLAPPGRAVEKKLGQPASAIMLDCLRLEVEKPK